MRKSIRVKILGAEMTNRNGPIGGVLADPLGPIIFAVKALCGLQDFKKRVLVLSLVQNLCVVQRLKAWNSNALSHDY